MIKLPEFKNPALFKQAFTHRSYLNEVREQLESNERLEFLGDSILSFVVSKHLYKTYPRFNEGILTNLRSLLVNTKNLASLAREADLGRFLLLSRGEEESGGRENDTLLANSFEALTGALYLDQGIEAVEEFLKYILFPKIDSVVKSKTFKDPKSLLQEYVQSKKQNAPLYKVIAEEGPPHDRVFTIGVYVNEKLLGKGTGRSKQVAEEQAAKKALEAKHK